MKQRMSTAWSYIWQCCQILGNMHKKVTRATCGLWGHMLHILGLKNQSEIWKGPGWLVGGRAWTSQCSSKIFLVQPVQRNVQEGPIQATVIYIYIYTCSASSSVGFRVTRQHDLAREGSHSSFLGSKPPCVTSEMK